MNNLFFDNFNFIALILIIPLWYINGFRFWLASLVFIYFALKYILEQRKIFLFGLILSFIIHYSFILPLGIFFSFILIKPNIHILFLIFSMSFISSNTDFVLNFIQSYTPDFLFERTTGYLNSERNLDLKLMQESTNFYARYHIDFLYWYVNLMLVILYYDILKGHHKQKNMLYFCFIITIFANFIFEIPSGSRFILIAAFFVLSYIVFYGYTISSDKYSNMYRLLVKIPLVFYLLVTLRIGFYSISVNTIFGNLPTALLLLDDNLSINDVLKYFL